MLFYKTWLYPSLCLLAYYVLPLETQLACSRTYWVNEMRNFSPRLQSSSSLVRYSCISKRVDLTEKPNISSKLEKPVNADGVLHIVISKHDNVSFHCWLSWAVMTACIAYLSGFRRYSSIPFVLWWWIDFCYVNYTEFIL